jgi:Endonuclease NucS C-terminal domain
MKSEYRNWLIQQQYDAGTIAAQLHRAGRVEKHYGDLDDHYAADRLQSVIDALRYTTDDKRHNPTNTSKIPFDGDACSNLASYRDAVSRYRRFRDAGDGTVEPTVIVGTRAGVTAVVEDEEIGQRIGLERDMQAALRVDISQLEPGLIIIDEGAERSVDSGLIDITARDASGAIVVIELKAGPAGQRAVAQILSYMGDVAAEEESQVVRGILVASDFDAKAKAAARMVPEPDTSQIQCAISVLGRPRLMQARATCT